jgi:hypothetical protein
MAAGAILAGACQRDVPRSQLPHFATFCVEKANWQDLLATMRDFGASHGLQLHGGIDASRPHEPVFNAYLSRGYSYWWGDDLDLWITSNPFVRGKMNYGGIAKKPWTKADLETAHRLLAATGPLQCRGSS